MHKSSLLTRVFSSLTLILLMLFDIGPVPVTALISLYIVIVRPQWFIALVRRIYGEH